jgi:hypothetical protein
VVIVTTSSARLHLVVELHSFIIQRKLQMLTTWLRIAHCYLLSFYLLFGSLPSKFTEYVYQCKRPNSAHNINIVFTKFPWGSATYVSIVEWY